MNNEKRSFNKRTVSYSQSSIEFLRSRQIFLRRVA